MAEQATLFGLGPGAPAWIKADPALLERKAALAPGGPPGWRPTRLILMNYWHFTYEEFHLVQGRLVLRGANASGKSTALAAAITLALDGEKRRERMDTFGGQGRSVAYYLVGDAKAGPGSEFYFHERTAYVVLEFEHVAQQRYMSVGLGLYTSRGRPNLDVDFWGFALTDGRRPGQDVALFDVTTDGRIPLTERQLRERIGNGGSVVHRQGDYQALVNRLLFGMSDEEYDDLLKVLVSLRSPKLNKDIKPSDVCEILARSLPGLEEDLLGRVTRIIEDIDAQQETLERTRAHLAAVRELDERLDRYLNQLAQAAALEYREASAGLTGARERVAASAGQLQQLEQELVAAQERLAALQAEQRELQGRIQALEQDPAFADERALQVADQDRDRAHADLDRAGQAVADSQAALRRLEGSLERLASEWARSLGSLRDTAVALERHASASAWPLAVAGVQALGDALGAIRLEESGPSPARTLGAAREAGQQRLDALRQALAAAQAVHNAQQEHLAAQARVEQAEAVRNDASDACAGAEEALDAARTEAVAALYGWRAGAVELRPMDPLLAQVTRGVQEYPLGEDWRSTLDPLVTELARQRRADLTRQMSEQQQQRAAREQERAQVEANLRNWLARQEAEPPRSPGQEQARALLEGRGIPVLPLYAACDFRPGVAPDMAAAIEQALFEAGILDALVVAPDQAESVADLLEGAGLGDRWLQPVPPAAGPTLADYLEPAPCALPASTVLAALHSIQVGAAPDAAAAVHPAGRWRVGVLAGASNRREVAEVAYIGAENRRRRREAEVRRLREELQSAAKRVAESDAALAALAARMEALEGELEAVWGLPEWRTLADAATEWRKSKEWLERCRAGVTRELKGQAEAYDRLLAAREQVEGALAGLPEARGRTVDGLRGLWTATQAFLDAGRHLADQADGLAHLWQEHSALVGALAAEQERLQGALANQRAAREAHAEFKARAEAILERLVGLPLEDLRRELKDCQARRERLHSEEGGLRKQQGGFEVAVRQQRDRAAAAERDLHAAEMQYAKAHSGLRIRLKTYPTLGRHLEQFEAGEAEALACAEDLLKLRRTAPDGLRAAIEETRHEAQKALTDAYYRHQSLLVDYKPEYNEMVTFRDLGARLLPWELRQRLEDDHRHQLLVVREKENELYEDFLLKQVAGHIRDLVNRGEEWKDQINRLLARRGLAGGEVLSIDWKPKPPDRVTGVNMARVVELLRQDPDKLRPEQVEELISHFRAQVEEVRQRERRGEQDQSFADALAQVLDYRLWFDFTLHTKLPEQVRQHMTDIRFTARSGAEKSLAMFIPLLAAAHARYRAARADAPRLVGLDEAFAGVDEENTRKMFAFLVELDFAWIMTSEKLWGVADTLPGCATYELVRYGTVVTPIFYVWDGTRRWGSLEGALREVAATDDR